MMGCVRVGCVDQSKSNRPICRASEKREPKLRRKGGTSGCSFRKGQTSLLLSIIRLDLQAIDGLCDPLPQPLQLTRWNGIRSLRCTEMPPVESPIVT